MENEFHKHLDKCRQCEEHPFNLCPIGAMLLKRTALEPIAQQQDFKLGDRVKVFDHLLYVDDKTTPLSMTMQPATVIRGNYTNKHGEEMVDVLFDREDRRIKESHGHFTWSVERILEVKTNGRRSE